MAAPERPSAFASATAIVGCGPTRSFSSTSSSAAPTGAVAKSGSMSRSSAAWAPGLAVGQVVLGPVSDAVGRRPVLVAGTLAFAVLSLAAAAAPSIAALNALRVLRGLAGAVGLVV